MNISLYGLSLFSVCLVFSGCSKPRPSAAVLTKGINATLPGHLIVECKTYQYSPIKEVLGTTLPEGSYQVDIQTVVKTKEALYAFSSFSPIQKRISLPEGLRAEIEGMREMSEWSWGSGSSNPATSSPKLQPFLVTMAKAHEAKELWTKVVAEPRGAEWLVTVVEGEPENAFSDYQPRAAFDARFAVFGSDEQRRNHAEVKAAYAEAERRKTVLAALQPEIKKLEESERDLAQKYEEEVLVEIRKLIVESRELGGEHDRRLSEITRIGDAAQDNYKTRDRLIEEESKRSLLARKMLADKIDVLQNRRSLTSKRAHAEIEAKIQELKKQHGLDS